MITVAELVTDQLGVDAPVPHGEYRVALEDADVLLEIKAVRFDHERKLAIIETGDYAEPDNDE